ncbi:hypothetical protein TWF481_012132 [Arthrobotrys musiformis]|uniref:Uncharacterized protein n=1 Tax=Arthrobotrys musiformis TaxID=47236 RepID=A0AAV9W291_9PEZI
MPPSRNSTLRTERTHEENQERAYIAASHRSDRSLEARMESARRASEIHKQRTGKFFQITEKAVLAGEVYMDDEEELPAPYYQLDQRLRPDAPDPEEFFNKLVEYLSANAFLRNRLSSAIEESNRLSSRSAAAAQRNRSLSTPTGYGEGPMLEQGLGPSVQTSSFSPALFTRPYQGPLLSTTPEPSNPPTLPTAVPNVNSQVNMTQFQSPINAQGTQFHTGPIGIGSLPQHHYQRIFLARRQTAPGVESPQQSGTPAGASLSGIPHNGGYSAVPTPEQYQAMGQIFPSRRPSAATVDITGSPMSDISMASFRNTQNPMQLSINGGSPDSLLMTRPSIPNRSTYIPHLQQQQHFPISPENANANTNMHHQPPTIITQDLSSPMVLTLPMRSREGSRSTSQSPALKRCASTDLFREASPTKSIRTEDSPVPAYSPAQSNPIQSPVDDEEIDLFDFPLPQNYRDMLYGPGAPVSGSAALSFAGATSQDLSGERPAEVPEVMYNFADPELDLTDSLLNQHLNQNNQPAFNMNFLEQNDPGPEDINDT